MVAHLEARLGMIKISHVDAVESDPVSWKCVWQPVVNPTTLKAEVGVYLTLRLA